MWCMWSKGSKVVVTNFLLLVSYREWWAHVFIDWLVIIGVAAGTEVHWRHGIVAEGSSSRCERWSSAFLCSWAGHKVGHYLPRDAPGYIGRRPWIRAIRFHLTFSAEKNQISPESPIEWGDRDLHSIANVLIEISGHTGRTDVRLSCPWWTESHFMRDTRVPQYVVQLSQQVLQRWFPWFIFDVFLFTDF